MLIFIHALSPLHVGIGHSPGAIDLPIARDKASGFPIVPGSGLKGAMRAHAGVRQREVIRVFGPETTNASDHAGGVHFGDAHLVALPVRSVAGTFAWATSPYLLRRFARDAAESGTHTPTNVPQVQALGQAFTAAARPKIKVGDGNNAPVILEDLDFLAAQDGATSEWASLIAGMVFVEDAWRDFFKDRFLIVHDDIMSYLGRHGIDVTSRNRLENDTKTVADGALWTEESLPTESLLCAFAAIAPNAGTLPLDGLRGALTAFNGETLQLGGNTTVGRGRCRIAIGGTL